MCSPIIVLLHYLSYCVWLHVCEALVEKDQSKTEVTSNRGQLQRALRCRGAWTPCSIWKGWWWGGPTAESGPVPKERRGTYWLHVCGHTHKTQTDAMTQARLKNTHWQNNAHGQGRNSNNAIRDSLMILEDKVCGRPLIFPLFLFLPQSLLQNKEPSRVVREQGSPSL